MKKPFKGKIYCWSKFHFDKSKIEPLYPGEDMGLGYCIAGFTTEIPRLGSRWRTSWVMKHYKNGSVETRNSRYKLVGKEEE